MNEIELLTEMLTILESIKIHIKFILYALGVITGMMIGKTFIGR